MALRRTQEMEGQLALQAPSTRTLTAALNVTTSGMAAWRCNARRTRRPAVAADPFPHTLVAALSAITSGPMARLCAARNRRKVCRCCWPLAHTLMAALPADAAGTMAQRCPARKRGKACWARQPSAGEGCHQAAAAAQRPSRPARKTMAPAQARNGAARERPKAPGVARLARKPHRPATAGTRAVSAPNNRRFGGLRQEDQRTCACTHTFMHA